VRKLLLYSAVLALALPWQARALEQSDPQLLGGAGERTLASQVSSQDPSYQVLKDLADRGALSRPFPQDGSSLSRAEMALLVEDAARTVLGPNSIQMADLPALPPLPGEATSPAPAATFSATTADKDAVYKLVQQYQDDLMKLGAKLTSIEDQLAALKQRDDDLNSKIDHLLKMTGLKINGEAVVQSIDFGLLPKGADMESIWPTVGYFDMNVNARPRPDMYAELVFRMETIFGAYWGSANFAGVRRFKFRADTPVGLTVGMLDYKDTPLTVWAVQDEFPYENPVYARMRKEGMDDLYLGDNQWPIYGALADTTLLWFDGMDQYIQVMGSKLATNGQSNSNLPFATTMPYDQYLIGGRTAFTLPSVVPGDAKHHAMDATLGFNYFEIRDIADSQIDGPSVRNQGVQMNNVFSSDLKLGFMDDGLVIKGEYAVANYNPDLESQDNPWAHGTAETLHCILNEGGTKIDAYGVSVDPNFINYAAQTRTQDNYDDAMQFPGPSGIGLYDPITANNYYNVSDSKYELLGQYNFLTRYNNVIYANYAGQPGGGKVVGLYVPYDPYTNNSTPYGEATPNRQGGGIKYNGSYAGGLIQPSLAGSYLSETQADWWLNSDSSLLERTFMRGQGGLKLDFNGLNIGWLPLAIWGGMTCEQTEDGESVNSPLHYADLVSATVDFGFDYGLTKKVHLLGGYQHQQWDGNDWINTGSIVEGQRYQWYYSAYLVDSYAGGVSWDISKATNVYLAYSQHNVWQGEVQAAGAGLYNGTGMTQEIDATVRMKF